MDESFFDAHTALVVVDVQNDLADPGGSIYVQGGEQIVPIVNRLVRTALDAGALVVYTQEWHPPTTPHFDSEGGALPVHCVQGTWGAHLHPDLVVAGPVVRKGLDGEEGYSGFTAFDPRTGEEVLTELHEILREHDVNRVAVVGLARDVCVKATALDARTLSYETAVLLEATRPVRRDMLEDHAAREELRAAGVALR